MGSGVATGSLAFDPVSKRYTFTWKTKKAWAGACATFELGLIDGSSHQLDFRLR